MRFAMAAIALGLGSYLSYAVYFDAFPAGDGGASKTRMVMGGVEQAVQSFGTGPTALGLLAAGVVLALLLVAFGPRDHA